MMNTLIRLGTQFFSEDLGGGDMDGLDGDGFDFDFSEDDVFEEDSSSVDHDGETETDAPAVPQEVVTPEAPAQQLFTVKYNGEETQLPLDELITNAQKGMNYDKIYAEREALKASPEFTMLDKLAQMNGMTRDQYVALVTEQQEQMAIEKQVQSGVPLEVAKRLHTLEQAEQRRIEEAQAQEAQRAQSQAYAEFAAAYPDVKEFPPEVIQEIASGKSPLNAYMAYENKQIKQRLAAYETNERNAKKSTGSLVGTLDDVSQDPFMAGFNSAL